MTEEEDPGLSPKEAGALLGLSANRLRDLEKRTGSPARFYPTKSGTHGRYRRIDIEELRQRLQTGARLDEPSSVRQVTAGQAGAKLGVNIRTIRAVEEAVGWPVSERTDGGHRRYSLVDIERLAERVGQGVPLRDAARLLKDAPAHAAWTDRYLVAHRRPVYPLPSGSASTTATELLDRLDEHPRAFEADHRWRWAEQDLLALWLQEQTTLPQHALVAWLVNLTDSGELACTRVAGLRVLLAAAGIQTNDAVDGVDVPVDAQVIYAYSVGAGPAPVLPDREVLVYDATLRGLPRRQEVERVRGLLEARDTQAW